jgi:fatty acid desaturase
MSVAATIRTTDPTYQPMPGPCALARWATALILDARDLPFLQLMAVVSVVLVPFAAWLYLPGRFRWWLAAIYLGINVFGFLDRCILMLHNTSHRVLFRPKYRLMNLYIPWVLGPIFGESPETYYSHHLGMHHPENNLEADLSSTMRFQRDRLDHFLRYFLRFFFLGIVDCTVYLRRRGRLALARRFLAGELLFLAGVGLLLALNWRATLVVFVIPVVLVRFLMMAGNWGQHAFIDSARPENCYVNAITCINTRYNRRCFNDGYHIGHHLRPNRHWTEMPGDFERNAAIYAREGALVFEGVDFFGVWLLLMLRRYDRLAKRYVNLDGRARPRDEIAALLRARAQAILRQGAPSMQR